MIIDLHIHTSFGSEDSEINPDELGHLAQQAGVDGICITEHGHRKSPLAQELAQKFHFPVFAGLEASTDLGDILVFGVEGYPRSISSAPELRQWVIGAGGAMVAAHPFRHAFSHNVILESGHRLTVERASQHRLFRLVDAMEVANGWFTQEEEEFCSRLSQLLGLRGTGGSDAHVPGQVGCCVTVFQNHIGGERELVVELKKGNFRAEDRRTREQKDPNFWFL